MVDETPEINRRALSRRVCELLYWHHADGRLKEMNCSKALSCLHKSGCLQMAEAVYNPAFNRRTVQQEFVGFSSFGVDLIPLYIKSTPNDGGDHDQSRYHHLGPSLTWLKIFILISVHYAKKNIAVALHPCIFAISSPIS
jgi:hypothetical protein